ncbi:MAG: phosphate ABC transporter permease subunit PstC [Candidatus Nanopelagicales bacterium]|nr:phosphate ABC transporter permease subunit PstC [Candidatus Nanopelagicales bacterium]
MTSVVISLLIVFVLFRGAFNFLSLIEWDLSLLSDNGWFPRRERFDLRTILVGSIVMGTVSMLVAVPFGLGVAVYLSEYASQRVRRIVKPIVEVLAGIPSVIVGYFVIRFVAPDVVGTIFNPTNVNNMLAAGIGIGILVIPIMASVSEDALAAVPSSLREASYGIGARKFDTVVSVVIPAAVSGLVAAFIIAVSRAIGETMVATMAGGFDGSGLFEGWEPVNRGLTMTAAMTNAVGGTDQDIGGPSFEVLYFIGGLLFAITLVLNSIGNRVVGRVREKY